MNAQNGFYFEKESRSHLKIPFRLIGNLIVLDVKLNDVPLSFILDTGANHTFLFNLSNTNSLELKDIEKIQVNGLGSSKSTPSIKSSNNKIQIGGLVNKRQSIHLILDKEINFSNQLGIPIHGIIGCDILKNFIAKISYSTKTIKLYNRKAFKIKKLKKYDELDLIIYKKRMYVNTQVAIENNSLKRLTMLLDTGSSDSVWIFKDAGKNITVPIKKFRGYLGTGIGGVIHGDRSRVNKIKLGSYELEKAKAAFPDSIDISLAYLNKNRDGSLGSGILKRFNLIFDYRLKKMFFKKNRFFRKPFEYNMSGIEIEHDGVRVEKVYNEKLDFSDEAQGASNARKAYSINNLFKTSLVPVFQIVEVREGSPAEIAGVRKGDLLLKVNKKETYRYQISEIIEMLSEEEGKYLTIEVERKGIKKKFSFELKRIL